ncbi:MAG: energy transducer TonB [Sphingobacteriales bacterium]|nr:MAG: energy transducer TonB [Sphingobacteriales bacterium]
METKQIASSRIEDLIFENRNKAYGAYDIRQRYNRNVGIATAVAVSLLLLFLISPMIIDKLTPAEEIVAPVQDIRSIAELEDVKPLDETKPPPPPVEVPPPPKIIKFVPPVITNEIVEADPPTIEEIKTTTTGAKEQEGDPNANYAPPVEEQTIIEAPKEDNTVYEFADELPKFKGDMYKYLQENIKYPPLAADNNVQGTVYLEMTVGKDGNISDVKIKKDIGMGCGKEAERVVRSMPKWEPGKQNGRDVSVKMTIPVKFVLQGG